jgi:hypothetical protein
MLISRQFKLTKTKLLVFLNELEADVRKATTLSLPPNMSRIQNYLEQIPDLSIISGDLIKTIASSQTGAVIFWGEKHKIIIIPPFPNKDKYMTAGYDTEPLRKLLTPDYKIGIILVRMGSYSIGIAEGENLILHKTGTGLVHGRQRQGGSSAARFQRRRKDQAHHFLERVGEHAQELIEAYGKELDYFVYGGARITIQQLQKESRYFEQFNDRILPPLLEIPDPRFDVLEKAITQIWSSRVIEWTEVH